MWNVNLFISTATGSAIGLILAYCIGSWAGAGIALIVGAVSYWGVILINAIRYWVWFRK